MAILSKGTDFTTGDQVTAAKLDALVDSATFAAGAVDDSTTALDSSTPKKIIVKNGGISSTQLANDSVTTVKVENNAITLAKMATQADQTVLGNVSGGTAVPTAVPIVGAAGILVNNDSLGTDDTRGATQGNIKAYVDSLEQYQLKYSGATGTFSSSTSYADLNLSSVVGSNRAMVIMEVFDASTNSNIFFRTKGSSVIDQNVGNLAGWGASATTLGTSNNGGTIVVVTDSSGIIEHTADSSITGINYVIQAYQKLA